MYIRVCSQSFISMPKVSFPTRVQTHCPLTPMLTMKRELFEYIIRGYGLPDYVTISNNKHDRYLLTLVSEMKHAVGKLDGQDLPCRLVSCGLQRRTVGTLDVYLRSENLHG